ncbi:MAG: hypothetical protein GYA17_17630 [Chloroflexi bacterium]|nr:hypothetical protein [Anaerolineaceae bacterium]NMB90183.1 hypothetical protein [Chloroflexota bacterium]
MNPRRLSVLLLVLLLLFNFQSVSAQTYSFQVQTSDVRFYVNEDGTARIEYTLDFYNNPGADPIDYVDIGLPTSDYDSSSIQADLGGQALSDIEPSPYVSPGIAIGLGDRAIPAGQNGQLHVVIGSVRGVLYQGEAVDDVPYASFRFSPNWFGAEYVQGNTDTSITLFLPPGVESEQPRYFPPSNWPGDTAPEAGYDEQGRAYYYWHSSDANAHTQYEFGAAFPASLVPASAIAAPPSAAVSTSSGSDISDFACCAGIFVLFGGIFAAIIYFSNQANRKRKLQYLPPKISIEGHGIKRGLTAVEAAILMEQPIDKVLTMVLFSVAKKGAATVITRDPLKLEVAPTLPEGLQPYENQFLDAFKKDKSKAQQEALQDMMIDLVRSVGQKMKGFSRKETIDYYQDIQRRAWEQVQAADTPDVKMQRFDEYLDWTMLDRQFETRTRDVFRPTTVFVPTWWWRYDPTFRSAGGGVAPVSTTPAQTSGGSSGGGHSLPHLPGADFAASVAGGIQSFSGGLLGDITSFTGKITNTTNPPPKPSPSSHSRSGGSGCACACACACAGCACACAGGGR